MSSENQTIAPRPAAPMAMTARGVELRSLEELYRFAQAVAKTPFAPRDFKSPEAIMIAVQYGLEVGLSPMQALQGVAVVNGKPSLYGDALIAVVQASGLLEDMREWIDGAGDARTAYCEVKRRGMPTPLTRAFSVADAKKAGLWGKGGPWTSYPDRMQQMRARGFALRDGFADALHGFISVDEALDYPTPAEKNVTPFAVVASEPAPRPNKNAVSEEQLAAIASLASERGLIPDEVSQELFGMPVLEISSGSAQRLVGHLKTLPVAVDAEPETAAAEPVEAPADDAQPFDEEPPPVTDAMAEERAAKRESEGRMLAASGRVERDEKAKCYYVKSDRQGLRYKVTKPGEHMACSCPDFKHNGDGASYRCKHVFAVIEFAKGPLPLVLLSEGRQADLLSALTEKGLEPVETLKRYGVDSGRVAECPEAVFDKILADLY